MVGSPGRPNQVFERAEVGLATVCEGNPKYEVRVLEVGIDDFYRAIVRVSSTKFTDTNADHTGGLPLSVGSSYSATLKEDQTEVFFNEELFVSVSDINTILGTATVVVGSPGRPNQVFERAEVGLAAVCEGNPKYEVRVLEVGIDDFYRAIVRVWAAKFEFEE